MFLRKKFFKVVVATSTMVIAIGGMLQAASARTGVVNGSEVNLRSAPSTNSQVREVLGNNASIEIIKGKDGWFNVEYQGLNGWIFGKYVMVGERAMGSAVVSGNNVNVRAGAGKGYEVLDCLPKGETVSLIDSSGEWYMVTTVSGTTGWIWSGLLKNVDVKGSRSGSYNTVTDYEQQYVSTRQKMVDNAKSFLGTRYEMGGMSPEAFDCSGFMKYVCGNFGIYLERIAADQTSNGSWVSFDNLQMGDLVFFDTDGGKSYINHVGMFIGNNQFIHASSGKGHVTISDLSGFYLDNFMTARRIVD